MPVKPLGAGGAATAVADDPSSPWVNPGGITRIRKAWTRKSWHIMTFPAITIGGNDAAYNFYRSYSSSGSGAAAAEAAISKLGSDPDPIWAYFSADPILFFEYTRWVVGTISTYTHADALIVASADDPSNMTMELTSDSGGLIGVAISTETNRLSFGVQTRVFNRRYFNENMPVSTLFNVSDLSNKIQLDSEDLLGVAIDLGAMATLADYWFPTIAFSVFNVPYGCETNYFNPYTLGTETICGTQLTGSVRNTASPGLLDPMSINVGASIMPRLSRKIAIRFSFDVKDIYVESGGKGYGLPGIPLDYQLAGGVELVIGNPIKLQPLTVRAGYSNGAVTYGLTLRTPFLLAEVAAFSEPLQVDREVVNDQRYVSKITFEF